MSAIKIIECPRDAMQGLEKFIPTDQKIKYINTLLKIGFDTLDVGSFVSPKAIPQLRDTSNVLAGLKLNHVKTKLLCIVANRRGAEEACQEEKITYLGFPLSVSDIFQQLNTNKSIEEALEVLSDIQNVCLQSNKQLVCYISMGFGNPYGEHYEAEKVISMITSLTMMGITIISLADTVGIAQPNQIKQLLNDVHKAFPTIELGVHLHAEAMLAREKIEAAWSAGCMRYDGALNGRGGCPMAESSLVGNIPTEILIEFFHAKGEVFDFDKTSLDEAICQEHSVLGEH